MSLIERIAAESSAESQDEGYRVGFTDGMAEGATIMLSFFSGETDINPWDTIMERRKEENR